MKRLLKSFKTEINPTVEQTVKINKTIGTDMSITSKKGYIPITKNGYVIKSGTVSAKAGRYYVSVLVEIADVKSSNNSNEGIGIDLGLKDFATVSNGKIYKNINKSAKLKKLEKQLRREQRCLSRKYENIKKGESTQKNIGKQKLKVQKLHHIDITVDI